MIDTHAHLDACEGPVSDLVARAREAGVTRIVTIGSGIESCEASLGLCRDEEGVVAALGIHPHQAGEVAHGDRERLRALLADPCAVAVGETGLDRYRDYAPFDSQLELFRWHIDLAAELGKPVVVHTRAADEETADALAALPEGHPVILHCFSSPGLLATALERRYYVSFAGNVTFPKAVDLRLSASQVPADRLLAETDSPYLAPQPIRGHPNEPAAVMHVLEALAAVRRIEAAELESEIEANASEAFGLE